MTSSWATTVSVSPVQKATSQPTGQLPVRSGDQIFVQRRVSVFREYIAPAGSITAALVAIVGLIIRN